MRPTGEVQKCPLKMKQASSAVNGPDMQFAAISSNSRLMMLGKRLADGRFHGRKVVDRGGGLPIDDPNLMS